MHHLSEKAVTSKYAEGPGRHTPDAVLVVAGEGHVELSGGDRDLGFHFIHCSVCFCEVSLRLFDYTSEYAKINITMTVKKETRRGVCLQTRETGQC